MPRTHEVERRAVSARKSDRNASSRRREHAKIARANLFRPSAQPRGIPQLRARESLPLRFIHCGVSGPIVTTEARTSALNVRPHRLGADNVKINCATRNNFHFNVVRGRENSRDCRPASGNISLSQFTISLYNGIVSRSPLIQIN